MKKSSYLYLFLLLSASVVSAQSVLANKPPSDPQIAPLPEYISFTKDFKYPPTKPLSPTASATEVAAAAFMQADVKVQRLEVVKTGDTRLDTQHFASGTVEQTYRQGTLSCEFNPDHPDDVTISAPWMNSSGRILIKYVEFPELSWVAASNFQGGEEQQGRMVFTYKTADEEAEVDGKTRLPLHAKTPQLEVWYTYLPTPTEKIIIPAKFIDKLKALERSAVGKPPLP